MSDIIPLATFRVDDTECVVLTRAQFDQVMAALDDRIDADAARSTSSPAARATF